MNSAEKDADQDQSIGRPVEWSEGRYEKDPNPTPDESVLKKPKEGDAAPDKTSTPVTKKDYKV